MKNLPFLTRWLKQLPDDHAEKLWVWLDGNPNAVEQMIRAICEQRGWGQIEELDKKPIKTG